MSDEKKFECVFGYGKCPVRVLIAQQQEEAQTVMKSVPIQVTKDVPPELAAFMQMMMASLTRMVQVSTSLGNVGPFCAACPKARKGVG